MVVASYRECDTIFTVLEACREFYLFFRLQNVSRGMYGKMATKREKERDRIEERKGFVARFTTFGKRIGDCRVNSGRKREMEIRGVYRLDRRKIVGDIDERPCSRF